MNKFIDNKGIIHKTLKQKEVAEDYRKQLEQNSGLSFEQILNKYDSELQRFQFGLKHLIATSSVISAVFGGAVNQKNSCRYKSILENDQLLVSSVYKVSCPYTGFKANELTCDPNKFAKLRKSDTNQLKMF